jgi:flotillin
MPFDPTFILVSVIVILFLSVIMFVVSRYRRCPSDKIMVIYGKVGTSKDGTAISARCIHGGAAFIWPVFQAYEYLDLTPMSISVDLRNALSRQNIRIDVPSSFTVGISTEPGVMQNAAERLLGLKLSQIQELAKDIIFGQLRLVIATMDIEEINTDRDKFLEAVSGNVETELKKIGLRLINVNVTDITDESGYIVALGKEAAAKAINDAKKSVAEQERDGSIGEANARRDQRIQVAAADSEAIKGENESRAQVAQSNATLRELEAEALRRATAAEKIAEARALQEAYSAEQEAEAARAAREKATQEADVLVKAEIQKRKMELEAEAQAEQARRIAKGQADAIYLKMAAEARGMHELLTKQAQGYAELVKATGGDALNATRMMLADKMEELMKVQVEAIKGIKIDKVTVWDSMGGKEGTPATANFLSGMLKSIPPMNEMFKMAGMDLPEYFGKDNKDIEVPEVPETVKTQSEEVVEAAVE